VGVDGSLTVFLVGPGPAALGSAAAPLGHPRGPGRPPRSNPRAGSAPRPAPLRLPVRRQFL